MKEKCRPEGMCDIEVPQLTRIFRAEAALIGIPEVLPVTMQDALAQNPGKEYTLKNEEWVIVDMEKI